MSEIAFVAGATGYTGREVVRELRARGIETHAHVRPDSSQLERFRHEFETQGALLDATPWEAGAMRETFLRVKPTLVFALLGTTRARAKRASKAGKDPQRESYEAVDYGLTEITLRASISAGTNPRFVYLSSLGVSDTSTAPYLEVRARIERELRQGTLPYTIARPSFITGADREESRVTEKVTAAVADSILSVVGLLGGRQTKERYSAIDATTLAKALVAVALDPDAKNQTLETEKLRAALR